MPPFDIDEFEDAMDAELSDLVIVCAVAETIDLFCSPLGFDVEGAAESLEILRRWIGRGRITLH